MRRLAVLLVFTGVLAVQTVASIWSLCAFSSQSNVWLGAGGWATQWSDLRSVMRDGGLRVSGLNPRSPADKAGLRNGDLIVEANGRSVAEHPDAFWRPLFFGKPGDTLALAWIQGSDPDAAMKQASALEALDSLAGAYAWASIWEKTGDPERAVAAFRRAVAHDTSSADAGARYQLGLFLVRAEKYDAAAAAFAEILARRPENPLALYQLGKADLLMKRNLDEAVRCFRRYLALPVPTGGSSPAMAHFRLGQVYDLQGRRDSALAELRRARALQPVNAEILRLLKELEQRK